MGLIVKPVEVVGNKGRAKVMALFDTGASSSFIRRDIADKLATFGPLPNPRRFMLGDGKNAILAQQFVAVDITIKGVTVFFPCWSLKRSERRWSSEPTCSSAGRSGWTRRKKKCS